MLAPVAVPEPEEEDELDPPPLVVDEPLPVEEDPDWWRR